MYIVFSERLISSEAQHTLSGQALKAIFIMHKYLHRFTSISVAHRLDLFEKLISPVLKYAREVFFFIQGNAIERIHLQFCKKILGVNRTTQNDFNKSIRMSPLTTVDV